MSGDRDAAGEEIGRVGALGVGRPARVLEEG
jgi:hypothetical protein